jgi:L-alanine-DL-glutamate epimerase-like enolase superfamily enzyme
MKITEVEVYLLTAPEDARPHWVSHFVVPTANDLLVRLRTDAGLEGFGLASSNTHLDGAARMFNEGLSDLIVGEDALAPERLYEGLFALSYQRRAHEKGWSRSAIVLASAAVDIAAWDLLGKAAGQPLYRLFGGHRSQA